MLGTREPEVYGDLSLEDIKDFTNKQFKNRDVEISWFQSNHEGELIERVQKASKEEYEALIINPGGYSHTSVALLDALRMCSFPIIEVHISNIYGREEFRQKIVTGKSAEAILSGLGKNSYICAIYSQLIKGN